MENYKYNIFINQMAIIENNLNLDIIDCAIFDCIKTFANSPKCNKVQADDGVFFWISHKKIIAQLPLIGIKTSQGIVKRVEKLINAGILEKSKNCESLGKSIYRFGFMYDRLEFAPPNESLGVPQQPFREPPNESLGDNIINNNIINDKGETPQPQILKFKSFKEFTDEDFQKEIKKVMEENPNKFPNAMVKKFYNYWSEKAANQKMRFQKQETWETGKRMSYWLNNNKS